jgi:hypothetical protein
MWYIEDNQLADTRTDLALLRLLDEYTRRDTVFEIELVLVEI